MNNMMDGFLFWMRFDNSMLNISVETWRNQIINIAPLHHLALESHARLGNNISLYSYQRINSRSFPLGIVLKDANEIYPIEIVFKMLKSGHKIVNIVDLVRLFIGARIGGACLDMDMVFLRSFPDGVFFGTIPAKLTGGMARKWGRNSPPCIVHDKSWDGKALGNMPYSIDDKMKPYLLQISKALEIFLTGSTNQNGKFWDHVDWIKRLPGLSNDYKVYPPISFGPIPAWLSRGKCYSLESPSRLDGQTKIFGYTMPSFDDIFNKAYCIQHWFESSAKTYDIKQNLWSTLATGSLLAQEGEFVLGNNWREILIEKLEQ